MPTCVAPDNIITVKSNCIICMVDKKTTQSHNCSVCTKDAWVICSDCNDKISNCPVCRTPRNPITVNIHNEISNHPHVQSKWNEICKCVYHSAAAPAFFVLGVYVGKIYIYLYCKGTCTMDKDGNPDNCLCYDFASRDGYWECFHYSVGEFMLGIVMSAILFSCCCLKNN